MKKNLTLIFTLICSIQFSLFSQVGYPIAHWDFNGVSGATSVKSVYLGGGLSDVSPSSYVKFGSGVIPEKWYTGNGFTCRLTSETLEQAIANNQYISFTLTPTTTAINITSVSFTVFSQNQNRSFALLSNVAGFSADKAIQAENLTSGTRFTIETPNHTNLTNPIEFRIYVFGINEMWETYGIGQRSATENYDLSVFGLIPDNQSPSKPINLTAANITTAYFDLKWDASTDNLGVTGYEIYKDGVLIGTSKINSYKVTNLGKSMTYSFTVKAKDAIGNTSEESDPISVTTSNVAVNKHKIGINPYFATDYTQDNAFADMMITSRDWLVGDYNAHVKAPLDENGWPTTDASVCVWAGVNNMYGTYKLRFTGSVTSIACGWGTARIENKRYDTATNTTTCDLVYESNDPGGGLYLGFNGTNGGIKNLKMMRPLYPGSTSSYSFETTFTNQFKNIISKFGTVRFLDWAIVNHSPEVSWAKRNTLQMYKGSSSWLAVPWEYMIQLCNETNTDAWINIPCNADDDYVRNLAQLWKDKLNPNLKLYVEFSNELWNFMFTQFSHNHQATVAEVESGNTDLNFDNEQNIWLLVFRRVAKKLINTSTIFRSVWGDENMMTRVRPCLMWQQGDGQNFASQMVLYTDYYCAHTNKPVSYYIWGAGGSAYYNPDNESTNLTLDNFWTSQTNDVENWRQNNHNDVSLAAALGCKRVAYEGGPSYDPCYTAGGCSEAVKEAAWNDPRIKQSVIDHHNMWSEYGGDLLCYYSSTGGYQWGFAKTCYDLNTYKYQAIDELNNVDRIPVSVGFDGPFTTDGNNSDYGYPSGPSRSSGTATLSSYGQWRSYMFRSDSANLTLTCDYSGASNSDLQIMCDGTVIYGESLTGLGSTPKINFKVESGLHSIKVRLNNNNAIGIKQISLVSGTTGVNNLRESKFGIYPTRIHSKSQINLNVDPVGVVEVAISNLAGMVVDRQSINPQIKSSFIAPCNLKNGFYVVTIQQGNKRVCQKILITDSE